eukprot:11196207-Lingulodinium_polyedra.AAC.1
MAPLAGRQRYEHLRQGLPGAEAGAPLAGAERGRRSRRSARRRRGAERPRHGRASSRPYPQLLFF